MKTKINKSEIFKSAWKSYKLFAGSKSFSNCLSEAWSRAKLVKVSASNLLEGMILKNGGGIVKNTSRGLRTPKGKIDVVISWPNGSTKMHTWNNSTQILVSAH